MSQKSDQHIFIKGARLHNLKGVDVSLQRNQITVVTGVSGSGKSSLVFDTLYAEGQRRYVESLSAYARQFIGKMNKPDVDYIRGISPAIAIEQKVNTRNPRSTVATSTEIYDYLKLLFARAGRTFSPVSGQEVKRHQVDDVVAAILAQPADSSCTVLAQVKENKALGEQLKVLLQKGFNRVKWDGKLHKIETLLEEKGTAKAKVKDNLWIVVDRIAVVPGDEEVYSRAADSVQTAFYEGEGECIIELENGETLQFSNLFEADGIRFEEPSLNFFSFNNPYGACKTCEGFGQVIGIDEDLVVPDKSLSVYEGAIAPWRGETMSEWANDFVGKAVQFDFPIHRAYYDLTRKEKDLLWEGNKILKGINAFFKHLEERTYKIQYRVMLSRYRGKTLCPDCKGTRLRKDAGYVKLVSADSQLSISDILLMSVTGAFDYFNTLQLNEQDAGIAERIVKEIRQRLSFLKDVGLGYLGLNRLSNTLSGGESQRINLATSLGSSLVGSLYVLDEPSIGLHSRDTDRLISVLKSLKALGNTVVVVEHDEDIMLQADQLIDMGPLAGTQGGEVVYAGDFKGALESKDSLTGKYLSGREQIEVPAKRRKWNNHIHIKGARENNLKNISVRIPLHVMTVVTGVSGSGKTSLIKTVLYPALQKQLGNFTGGKTGEFDKLDGDIKTITQVEMVDQNPIGKSSRSNPVTYIKAYDAIRELFADQPLAKNRQYKPQHFSFNVDGGRCEVCQGEGETTVEMQFMADLHLPCEACNGKRFKEEILEVTYKDKNIHDVLTMTVDDALEFFEGHKAICNKLRPLVDVGLGYVTLGQSSSTLSGGEAQRIKLASFIAKGNEKNSEHILFIFDEPTTGLHFHDIKKLLASFEALIKQGNSILIIEHNPDVIKCADWVIDLGPEGGEAGGNLVFEGVPEDLVKCEASHTGRYLKPKL